MNTNISALALAHKSRTHNITTFQPAATPSNKGGRANV
jgi:hypothetical protein